MKKIILYLTGMFLILFSVLALRPVPAIPEEECEVTTGVVTGLFEGGEKDIVFKLEGDNKTYYINRGLEHGLVLESMRQELIRTKVVFTYPKHWTPLDPTSRTIHLAKVEYDGRTLYSEFD